MSIESVSLSEEDIPGAKITRESVEECTVVQLSRGAKTCGVKVILIDRYLSPSRRREAPCEGTNSPRLFTPGETKALAESKVHQISRAWVTNRGWSSSLISNIWRTVMNSGH
jgi:hypothetical protein